jgi:hypothetical protein
MRMGSILFRRLQSLQPFGLDGRGIDSGHRLGPMPLG